MGRTAQSMWYSLAEAAELVRTRAVSPVELTRACVDRISMQREEIWFVDYLVEPERVS